MEQVPQANEKGSVRDIILGLVMEQVPQREDLKPNIMDNVPPSKIKKAEVDNVPPQGEVYK